jgi:uncharacterized membrane protein YbhN (UPF0104 family)
MFLSLATPGTCQHGRVEQASIIGLDTRANGRWRRVVVAIAGTLLATGILAWVLYDTRDEFAQALKAAPILILVLAAFLQLVALVTRTEAWHICVEAAGATCGRRQLFHAAALGSLASQLNSQLGTAARIAILRRSAGDRCPRVPALIAAEIPIMSIEGGLAALTCFTLVGPLNLPWWVPFIVLAVAVGIVVALTRWAHRRPNGFASGLAILRSMKGSWRVIALILIATFAQIARNWLMLHALGVDATFFDAIAILILQVSLSQLPIGPTLGATAVVLILGANGVAITAAAGVLLTATATVGGLAYLAWGVTDRFVRRVVPA